MVRRRVWALVAVVVVLVMVKAVWVWCATREHGSFEGEKVEMVRRANYLTSKVATSPQQLLEEMPSGIGPQFRGEWALYSCSMTCAALANIAMLYPQNRQTAISQIRKMIDIALSPEMREYDANRWDEDPLEGLHGDLSHISYYSHVAWMISNYKQIGGDREFDGIYNLLCRAMDCRIRQSPSLNLPTYPGEGIYVPDMLVAIVALANYSRQHNGEYAATVNQWTERAKREWADPQTGLLLSFLSEDGKGVGAPVKGSYAALNCYYLTYIDKSFAFAQYQRLKKHFLQTSPVTGIREYCDRNCWLGLDIDAGPILLNLSPSGTAFALGCATFFHDWELRSQLLRTAEMAGTTVTWLGRSHYLLANVALVGEAIALAMRTSVEWR